MNNMQTESSTAYDAKEEDILAIYGDPVPEEQNEINLLTRRREFRPWHHPVKQIVRTYQWEALARKLLQNRDMENCDVLRYFTLPGADLLDVRVLAKACEPFRVRIEYFGFDSGSATRLPSESSGENGVDSQESSARWVSAESVLLQSGLITPNAVIYSDRLEDIAVEDSHAAMQLSQRAAFDIINIDACDHLAYCPKGRDRSMFHALEALLKHQMRARTPWLLFITTRADPELLGEPGMIFQEAIAQNLRVPGSNFGDALATCLEADEGRLFSELASIWTKQDARFLKLYSVGLSKYLLQFFHAQPSLPSNVELVSVYSYRVYTEEPDMLALAFRITPDGPRFFSPSTGGAAIVPPLEAKRAVYVPNQAKKIQDIDLALESEDSVREAAVNGTRDLLGSANYDVEEWGKWLENHEKRPMILK